MSSPFSTSFPSDDRTLYLRAQLVNTQSLPIQDESEKSGQLVYDWDMRLIMNDEQLQTIEQIKQFLEGSEPLEFRDLSTEEKYK